MDRRFADLRKAKRSMEGVRSRIGRFGVDLAGDDAVARASGLSEQILVEPAGMAVSARLRRCGDGSSLEWRSPAL